ncbi:Ankyrin repeat and sterile alpha motif domain-containing protein 1B [Ataeniobius toweri]|uniref:Ankyrin repeat and sterile alpha motif domain-containing protein 1B n=1 Tax=Ataeniobius toweri TaxID=208326 RepID=A0ABU7BCJ0_9TELE|nr:Ankyrin repeat and sterile alpha motif domain-containing protein 1B [Ataeniobius toweri]
MDVVRLLLDSGIDTSLRDSQGRTALEILRDHPAPKSQQITALIQEYMMDEMEEQSILEEPVRKCPVPAPRTSIPSPAASPSLRHKNDAVTSELSKLLHDIKKCRDRDYSFEELCHTISSHSMDSFGSGRLSDEERPDRPNGTLTRVSRRPTPPLAAAVEEDEVEKTCGPTGFWEAFTPCNGCHNLGVSSGSQLFDRNPANRNNKIGSRLGEDAAKHGEQNEHLEQHCSCHECSSGVLSPGNMVTCWEKR